MCFEVRIMDEKCKTKRRRRRVVQLKASEDDSCDETIPLVRSKPRKKCKEPSFEEDIVDGFSVLSFKTYDDLEVSFYYFNLVIGDVNIDKFPQLISMITIKKILHYKKLMVNKSLQIFFDS